VLSTKEAIMTDARKFGDQTPENKSKVTGELTDRELNQVSGGATSGQEGQKDPAQMFQRILEQLTQGKG
jgi:bacteriocin-like protein